MQQWADMLDCRMRGQTAREMIASGKVKVDEVVDDAKGMSL